MLYIRHGQKSYSNRRSLIYSLDPELTQIGRIEAKDRFKYLLNKFGIPNLIITSPYLRTRETAQIAKNIIFKETGIDVPITHDSSIGEYLGNQHNVLLNSEVRPETLKYNPVPPETWDEFIKRVENHLINKQFSGWYITHGLFIQKISSFLGFEIPYPKELSGIYVNNKEIKIT